MSLQSRLEALVAAIGADVKALQASSGGGTPLDMLQDGVGYIIPKDGAAGFDMLGSSGITLHGTATAADRTITTKYTRARKTEYLVTTAATTAVAGWRQTNNRFLRGNAAGMGGFTSRQHWGPATGVSVTSNRAFVGLIGSSSAPTDVNPSTQTSCIGMGWDSTDANVQIMYNDASGTCTKVDLGSNFVVPTADRTQWYGIEVSCLPNDTKLSWKATNYNNNITVTGDTGVSTDIPANTLYLMERGYMSVGGTSSVIGIGFGGLYYNTAV